MFQLQMSEFEESVHNDSGINGDFPEIVDTDEENDDESSQLNNRNNLDKVNAQ